MQDARPGTGTFSILVHPVYPVVSPVAFRQDQQDLSDINFVKEEDGIERLILGAGGNIFFGQSGEEPFQLLLTVQPCAAAPMRVVNTRVELSLDFSW